MKLLVNSIGRISILWMRRIVMVYVGLLASSPCATSQSLQRSAEVPARASQYTTAKQYSAFDEIIFWGNCPNFSSHWRELAMSKSVRYSCVESQNTQTAQQQLSRISAAKPRKLFLLFGNQELAEGGNTKRITENYLLIINRLRSESPHTQLYLQGTWPKLATVPDKSITILNEQLQRLATQYGCTYVDVQASMQAHTWPDTPIDSGSNPDESAKTLWETTLFPHIFDLDPTKPSLIPFPQKLSWQQGSFLINHSFSIEHGAELIQEAQHLENHLTLLGGKIQPSTSRKIRLIIKKIEAPVNPSEAYQLRITQNLIELSANTKHGIFNGIQTLRQLARDGVQIPACLIEDYPAFAWRGLMHDVGRNFQQLDLLKTQIDVMAAYKLNVFHLHLTEDVAWRLESKVWPTLTNPEMMTRNKGQFYSQSQLKTLIEYCRARHITLIPEIDMPGHSQAFKRATGHDMQSQAGMRIVEDILHEFCREFDVEYLHLGGDEVRITNPDFLPTMVKLVESYGKKVIGWEPGGNLPPSVIRQLWQGRVQPAPGRPSLDSRFLYLNHHDPLESVATIFQAKIAGVERGDADHLGGIVCVWPDRRVADEMDILRQNPVLPGILAASERLWRGGGLKLGKTLIPQNDDAAYEQFVEFERRLLDHKRLYFNKLPFPYVQQSQVRWHISPPFANQGKLETKFTPELGASFEQWLPKSRMARGGTIYLRHWWRPMAESFLAEPTENTTVYAFTKVWSDFDQTAGLWVGFNQLSRSTASDTPTEGSWDNRNSRLWVNGRLVEPYLCLRAGQKGDSEIPLHDEGYEYRPPLRVQLKKGWNDVLVKAPVGSFAGDSQNPVKWMFTVIFVEPKDHNPEALPLRYWSGTKASSLEINEYFESGMVVQQKKPLYLVGKSATSTMIELSIFRENKSIFRKRTVPKPDHSWQIRLPPRKASAIPERWVLSNAQDTIILSDVLIGDVWVCAGQSNMAFELKNDQYAASTLQNLYNPRLKLFNRKPNLSTYQVEYSITDIEKLNPSLFYQSGTWQSADSVSASRFSAVGYYFGKSLQEHTKTPIGLINVAVGGSPCEAWIPAEALQHDAELSKIFRGNWLNNDQLEPWCIKRAHQNLDKLLQASAEVPSDTNGPNHPFKPGFLYQAAIAPLINLPVKGIIWYQGESNSLSGFRVRQHAQLLPKLVAYWRKMWKAQLPFYFCQLSSIDTSHYQSRHWPDFRESQRLLSLSIPNVGMAVTSDIGHPTDVHPTNKKEVGERLARLALRGTYRMKKLSSHPVLEKVSEKQQEWILYFDQALRTADGQRLRGFEWCNSAGQCIPCKVQIVRNTIHLAKPASPTFTNIRYAWLPYSDANLVSAEGLPVSTFQHKSR